LNSATNKNIEVQIKEHISDTYMLKWLDQQYNIR